MSFPPRIKYGINSSGNPVLLTISAKAFNWRFPDNQKRNFSSWHINCSLPSIIICSAEGNAGEKEKIVSKSR